METEKLQAEERMNTMDLMARIQLMQQKNSGATNVATIQSATKRVSDSLQRQASMETALINASTKEKPSDGPKTNRK